MADSFLSHHTTAETNHDVLRHADVCPGCRADLDGRRRVRTALRGAFHDSPELEPLPDFPARLRSHMRAEINRDRRRVIWRVTWMGLAAGVVLAIAVTGAVMMQRGAASAEALARDAIGDHQKCALKYRMVRMGVPLSEAAARIDSRYELLINAPPDTISTPGGPVRVLERHACAYDSRWFGHVIMKYHDHVLSLLMTEESARSAFTSAVDRMPHAIGRSTDGLSVVSVNASNHSILLVGDLGSAELTELSKIIAKPLAERLTAGALPGSNPALVAGLQIPVVSR